MNWNRPDLEESFDIIAASEIIYREESFEPLVGLFQTHLKPAGQVILAEGLRKTTLAFFASMEAYFEIKAQKKVLRSPTEEIPVILARMRLRENPPPIAQTKD
jgi:hypothetical protein